MGAHVQCPRCEQAYALSDEQALLYAGREFECAQCTLRFMIPTSTARPAPAHEPPPTLRGELPREQVTAAAVRAPAGMALAYPHFGPAWTSQFHSDDMRASTSRLAAASMIFGIIGLLVPVVPGALAILLGLIAAWRIHRGKAQGAALASAGVAVGVAGLILSGAMVYPRVLPAVARVWNASASQPQCVDHFRTIERALMAHAAEHDGHFPDSLADLVASGAINAEDVICAASGDHKAVGKDTEEIARKIRAGRHCSYVYVGKGLTKDSPGECVLMYEPLNAHRDSGISVLFVDGRVEKIGSIEAAKAVTRLSAGQNPPWSQ